MEAIVLKCETFVNITRLLKIFPEKFRLRFGLEMWGFYNDFKTFSGKFSLFQGLRGFLNTIK
jgi:hypothetical protein